MGNSFYTNITILLNYLAAIFLVNFAFITVLFTLEELRILFFVPTMIFDFSAFLIFAFGYKNLLRKVYLDEGGLQERVFGKLIVSYSWQEFDKAKVIIKYNSRYLLLNTYSNSEILFNFRKSRLKRMRNVCNNYQLLDKLELLDNSFDIRFKK
jgi:hypothetical protein